MLLDKPERWLHAEYLLDKPEVFSLQNLKCYPLKGAKKY